uniref:C2H2-type domain-containing protein n=1 Tax=Arion vulgaris TaxID=1028688 RepID=A0A0B6YX63_9EUPU
MRSLIVKGIHRSKLQLREILSSNNCTEATQLMVDEKFCDANIDKGNSIAGCSLGKNSGTTSIGHLQCTTCRRLCTSIENLSEHLKDHINQVLAVQKVREWTSKSSEYFFLGHLDDEDELEGEGSASTATTSYFDSEITSTTSSAVQDIGSNFSSLELVESKDANWTKPQKKSKRHRHKGEITVCEFCMEKFAFRKDLYYHMETCHKDSTLECPVCRKKFSWKKRGKFYERHLNSHYGVKIFKHKCSACGKTFLENSKLRAHMSLHNSELLHKCTICGRGYANKSSLVRHERKHTGVKPYQCGICSEGFMEKRELLRHSTTHTGLSPFNCDECGQGFTLKTSLVSHMKKKHSKKKSLRS